MQPRHPLILATASVLSVTLLCGFGLPFRKKKYDTAISKDTMQPDKVLYDKAVKNIEKGQYLAARLTLQTLINTYDTSEYLAKAKLAIADSWFREGDTHGLAQAEIEYKDFILFYPNMEEAAESQFKICDIHFKQMLKPDRDSSESQRAEDACRDMINQFPNSKFKEQAEQKLREVQEVLADKEFRNALYYYNKGSLPAAQGRLSYVTQQYPLYSGADQALWMNADAFRKMGDRFEEQEADSLTRIVRDYPISIHVNAAKARLTEMKRPVPNADPAAYARMKYNVEHEKRAGFMGRALGVLSGRPDVGGAAKQGAPIMTAVRPNAPVSVPQDAAGTIAAGSAPAAGGVSDVGIGVVGSATALDQKGDARLSNDAEHKASVGSSGISTDPAAAPQAPLPTNHPFTKKQLDEIKRQQDAAAKVQKKAADAAAKKGGTATPAPAQPGQPATPAPAPQQ